MPLYLNQNSKLKEVEEKAFKLEREIQKVFEDNLDTVMGLSLVKSEFTIKNKRIDTLAFDKQSNAFIIIEYKRDRSLSVVDQGFTYLSLMLENKADFIIEYNESLGLNLKRDDVDWSQTRVVFVSTAFTENQILATNFKDIAIELWEVKRFENNLISITPIKKTNSATSIKPVMQQNQSLKLVSDEIKVYTEDDLLESGSDKTVELYNKFKVAILNLDDDIEVRPLKQYIAFKKDSNILCMTVQKKQIRMWLGAKYGSIDDARGIGKDVTNIGHWGTGDYEIAVSSDKDLEYIMSLVKQVI
ncbi:MAG: putative transport protein [Methylophilaceae bacterium]|jgi:predicted transport protein